MDFFINLIIIILFISPIIALIHESGHAFFLKIFRLKISEFSIGNGEVIWRKNNFLIKQAYFFGGRVVPEKDKVLSKKQRMLFCLGGVLFNFLTALAPHLLTGYEFFVFRNYLDSFIFVSYFTIIVNLIPFRSILGDTDGKQLLNLFKE